MDKNYQIVDDYHELSWLYGMETVVLSQNDINKLKEGKFLYFTVNDEYTALVYVGGQHNDE